jgi:hypothetical protein
MYEENSGVRAFRQLKSRSSAKKNFRLRGNATEVSLVHLCVRKGVVQKVKN